MSQPILKVTYIITDQGIGGAERHVTTLMSHLDRERFDSIVICRRPWVLLVFELWARAFLNRSVKASGERPSLVSQQTAVFGGRT